MKVAFRSSEFTTFVTHLPAACAPRASALKIAKRYLVCLFIRGHARSKSRAKVTHGFLRCEYLLKASPQKEHEG